MSEMLSDLVPRKLSLHVLHDTGCSLGSGSGHDSAFIPSLFQEIHLEERFSDPDIVRQR